MGHVCGVMELWADVSRLSKIDSMKDGLSHDAYIKKDSRWEGLVETEVEMIECRRCKQSAPKLDRAPFRTELGAQIQSKICKNCWADWLQHQTLLINHYGLDPRDAKARAFLYQQIETVLLGEGDGGAESIDTSKQGSIEW